MIHLEIGRKTMNGYGYGYGLDNTTKAMNFTRCKRSSKVMQILHAIITHPRQLTARDIKRKVYGADIGERCHGFFSALHHFGLASYERHGRTCLWAPTIKGICFYMGLKH